MEKELSNKEILRQQLELLAERSQSATHEELPRITLAMVKVCNTLKEYKRVDQLDMPVIIESFARKAEEAASKLADTDV